MATSFQKLKTLASAIIHCLHVNAKKRLQGNEKYQMILKAYSLDRQECIKANCTKSLIEAKLCSFVFSKTLF